MAHTKRQKDGEAKRRGGVAKEIARTEEEGGWWNKEKSEMLVASVGARSDVGNT